MYDSKCHLQDCTFLTVLFTKGIQIALKNKKKRERFCCIVHKVMFDSVF